MGTYLARWPALAAATALLALAAGAAGVPSAALFAALLTGVVWALAGGGDMTPPRRAVVPAQAIIGAALGSYFELGPLADLGGRWVPVAVVVVGTLGVSLLAGLAVAAATGLDRPTALLGLVAGGAAGIVALSDELGADARLVAVMQYARVLVVVLLAPLLMAFAFGAADAAPAQEAGAGVTAAGVLGGAGVPGLVEELAFAVVGVQVGLRFTRDTVRRAGRLLPVVLVAVLGMVAACAALAVPLAAPADVRFADAYLATTPGGIYAVLATAVGGGANTTFVTAVQVLRVLILVLAAPPLMRLLAR